VNKWYAEEWRFAITVLHATARPDGSPDCRVGLEPGDVFECTYECPAQFCPKALLKLFPLMEAVRSGGDLRNLGGNGPGQIEISCPDGAVQLQLVGERIAG